MKPVIFGLAGETLGPDERAFFAEVEPAGYILFCLLYTSPSPRDS